MLKSILSIGAAIAMLVSTSAVAHENGFIYIPPLGHGHAHTNVEPHYNMGEPPRLNYQTPEFHGHHLDGHWAGFGPAPGNARWYGNYVWSNGITYVGCYSFPTVDDYGNSAGWVIGCPIGGGQWMFTN